MSHKDDVFVRLFIGILVILTLFTIGAIILGNKIGKIEQESVAGLVQKPAASAASSKPAATEPAPSTEAAAPAPAAEEPKAAKSGDQVIQMACASCHMTGVAGAPKLGDAEAWGQRATKGMDTLVHNAINGLNAMPPKGGNMSLSDEEIHSAVAAMLDQAGVEAGGAADAMAATAEPAGSTPAAADGAKGKQVYTQSCFACHGTGAAGAPVMGNPEQWGSRITKGKETLYNHALHGFNAMPAKGGFMNLGDEDVKAAVDYMVAESQ